MEQRLEVVEASKVLAEEETL
eukprot:SAG31_NODE_41662_length_275_cov_0.585227_1_plen_20_part_10